jgi:hypothetical protein
MGKWLILFVLALASCMVADDGKDCKEPEKITVYDTVTVVRKDTVRTHDTVRVVRVDTLRIRDTVTIRDTVKILANVSQPDDLFGTWEGASGSQKVIIAFTSSIGREADFSATLGSVAGNGYITTLENGQAKVTHAGFKDVTWLLSLEDGILTIEEIGVKFFAGQTTTLKKR